MLSGALINGDRYIADQFKQTSDGRQTPTSDLRPRPDFEH